MSIQTYSDIIAIQPKIQDLQVSSQNKISQNSSSTSFAEMVALYRNENKSENVTEESHVSENVQKNESVKSENDVTKSETVQESENTEKTEYVKDGREEKTEIKDEKNASKVSVDSVKNQENSDKVEKVFDEKSGQKKIEKKDFSRLNQITENATADTEKAQLAAANVDVKTVEIKNQNLEMEIGGENEDSEISVALLSENTAPEMLVAVNQNGTAENDSQELDFEFNQQEPSGKKVSVPDKEGKITVEDFRTKLDAEPKTVNEENEPKLKAQLEITSENAATITMDLAQNAQSDILSLNNQTAASDGSNFRAMLNNQIQNNAPEFVKAGNIILRDNNQGTIDLVLHPDDLGNVKIHLSLDGKNITGQIAVTTKEALEVFKDNAETLREAFIKSGFEAANFDVAYGNNNSGFGQNGEFTNQNDGRSFVAHQVYGSLSGSDDSEAAGLFENSSDLGNYSINIVA